MSDSNRVWDIISAAGIIILIWGLVMWWSPRQGEIMEWVFENTGTLFVWSLGLIVVGLILKALGRVLQESGMEPQNREYSDDSAQGSLTECPYCRAELRSGVTKCRHCGEWVAGDSTSASRRQDDDEGTESGKQETDPPKPKW